jgi:hypothetical protein
MLSDRSVSVRIADYQGFVQSRRWSRLKGHDLHHFSSLYCPPYRGVVRKMPFSNRPRSRHGPVARAMPKRSVGQKHDGNIDAFKHQGVGNVWYTEVSTRRPLLGPRSADAFRIRRRFVQVGKSRRRTKISQWIWKYCRPRRLPKKRASNNNNNNSRSTKSNVSVDLIVESQRHRLIQVTANPLVPHPRPRKQKAHSNDGGCILHERH